VRYGTGTRKKKGRFKTLPAIGGMEFFLLKHPVR